MSLRSACCAASVGAAAALAWACGTSAVPGIIPDASAPDASNTGCLCSTDTCRDGVIATVRSPVPFDGLAGARLQVCRRLTDCMSAPLESGGPVTLVDATTLRFDFGTLGVDPKGDRYTVAVFRDPALLYYGAADATQYQGQRVSKCERTVNGNKESCDPGRFDCQRGAIDVTLAPWSDAGAEAGPDAADGSNDGASDAPLDVAMDAPDAD